MTIKRNSWVVPEARVRLVAKKFWVPLTKEVVLETEIAPEMDPTSVAVAQLLELHQTWIFEAVREFLNEIPVKLVRVTTVLGPTVTDHPRKSPEVMELLRLALALFHPIQRHMEELELMLIPVPGRTGVAATPEAGALLAETAALLVVEVGISQETIGTARRKSAVARNKQTVKATKRRTEGPTPTFTKEDVLLQYPVKENAEKSIRSL